MLMRTDVQRIAHDIGPEVFRIGRNSARFILVFRVME